MATRSCSVATPSEYEQTSKCRYSTGVGEVCGRLQFSLLCGCSQLQASKWISDAEICAVRAQLYIKLEQFDLAELVRASVQSIFFILFWFLCRLDFHNY